VKHLDKSVDDAKLKEMFSVFGPVTSAVIMRDENEESKGFGFINFEQNESAVKAIEEMNEKELDGKQLYVGRAQKKSERDHELKEMFLKIQKERQSKYQGVNLYIKNLDEAIDDEKLRQEFSPIGTITSAKVMTDDKGVSKGFGFVCFSTPEEATKAVTEMNGKLVGNKPIYVALAQRKDQRKQQLEALQVHRQGPVRMPAPGMAMYAPAPMFYPPGVYPARHQMMPPARGRFPGQPRGYPIPPGAYNNNNTVQGGQMQPVQGGGFRGRRGGRGGFSRGGARGGPQGNVVANGVNGNPNAIQQGLQYQYNPNVRNQQMAMPQPMLAQEPTSLTPEERKNMIGETIYPLIEAHLKTVNKEDQTGKITGMLLESLDQTELMQVMESQEELAKRVTEALDVLSAHAASLTTAQ